ncbi:FliG C-terminal domain-containing protein [Yoonia sp. 2307UL14-13]|uniref:FliG C-terminal domain-containing protein n=1 Tax=Yoonia sp. 2307UL14-13 TaxID=3126506 RepID=UPI0030AD8F88
MTQADQTTREKPLTRRRKAAVVVQMLLNDGGQLALSSLPESLQEVLADELGDIRLIDRDTVNAVAAEFAAELESVGLTAPISRDAAITALADHLSAPLADRLRARTESARNGDHWPVVLDLSVDRIAQIMTAESTEICAILLSKLPVAKAAEVLQSTEGSRARRITFAMSQTADVSPDVVRRIGKTLATDYGRPRITAFDKAPVQRLGAILNSTANDTREDLLAALGETDPDFASDVRKAIFTFKDIPHRIQPLDVPNCIRPVDGDMMITAIAAALAGGEDTVQAAEFILSNMSQRMADQLREDASEKGTIKKADAEKAMNAVTTAIRDLADRGDIILIDPDAETADG